MKLPEFEELYLKTKLQPGLVSVYSNRLIQQIGAGLLGLFLPIFLYGFFDFSIQKVIYFYLALYALFGILVPFGAMMMSKIGLKISMIIGSLFFVGYFVFLFMLSNNMFFAIFLAIASGVLFRIFYWVPYHTELAKLGHRKSRGKELALLFSVSTLVSVFLPIIAGAILNKFDFSVLFLIAIIITGVSIFPILFLKPVKEKFTYSYFQTFKELFKKKNRKLLLSCIGDGAEFVVGLVIWPIFIFQILNGNYLSVGIVSSLIILFTIILRLLIGDLTDRKSKRGIIKAGSIFHALGWIGKIFIASAFQIFVVSAYHSFTAIIVKTPFLTLLYEQAADRGHYVDEYTVLKEIALNIGRVLTLFLLLILLSFTGLTFAFVIAAFASLLINLL